MLQRIANQHCRHCEQTEGCQIVHWMLVMAREQRLGPAMVHDRYMIVHGPMAGNGRAYAESALAWLATLRDQWRWLELNPQRTQDRRVCLWLESRGLVPMFWQHTHRYGVPVSSFGGYDPASKTHAGQAPRRER